MDVIRQMREDWDRRAAEDPHFYAGFGRRNQSEAEFLASGAETAALLTGELSRLPEGEPESRRALEIGCGPGRLLVPMSRHFGEIHGVDISAEMAALARERLRGIPHASVDVASGDGLGMFSSDYFDFVYSYAVFQHIPDAGVIRNYIREARRVLKPGGVLCCQARGAPPLASELGREAPTWTGVFFSGGDMAAISREDDFPLVAISGLETQYLWTTWVKPGGQRAAGACRTVLKAVTAASGGESAVPVRGRDAAVSLWIDGLPHGSHLGNLEIAFGGNVVMGCYLSPVSASGSCQLNARLPEGLGLGRIALELRREGRALCAPREIELIAPTPLAPRVLSVSDGIAISSRNRTEMGGVKVTIEEVGNPAEVTFEVDGRPAEFLQFERKDPITSTYEFAFHLSPKTRLGQKSIVIRVAGAELPPVPLEVAGLSEDSRAPQRKHAGQQHQAEGKPAGDAPLGAAVEGKGDRAWSLARWFNRKKP